MNIICIVENWLVIHWKHSQKVICIRSRCGYYHKLLAQAKRTAFLPVGKYYQIRRHNRGRGTPHHPNHKKAYKKELRLSIRSPTGTYSITAIKNQNDVVKKSC